MIAIDINGRESGKAHENWEELVKDGKYLPLVNIIYTAPDVLTAKQQVLHKIYGVDARAFAIAAGADGAPLKTSGSELADMITDLTAMQVMDQVYPIMDFIFKPELLTENPLPVIKHKWLKYYGPGEKLAEQTGAEMEECGWAHAEYLKTGEEKYLDQLVAALYRPRWLLIGPRIQFSSKYCEKLTRRLAGLDPLIKRGVLLFYEMCEEWWRQNYPDQYDKPVPKAAKEEPEQTKTDDIDSLACSRIIRALAGNKRGTVEAVRKMTRQEIYFELMELERTSRK